MIAEEYAKEQKAYFEKNPPPPPPPIVPTVDRVAALLKQIPCKPEGPLECDACDAMCASVKVPRSDVSKAMDTLEALLERVGRADASRTSRGDAAAATAIFL